MLHQLIDKVLDLGVIGRNETIAWYSRAGFPIVVWGAEMGSGHPVAPAQLVDADLEIMEGTLVIFRLFMFLGGARNFRHSTAHLQTLHKRRAPFHQLLQASGEKFGLLNSSMSVTEL